jgi:hypothetical protein
MANAWALAALWVNSDADAFRAQLDRMRNRSAGAAIPPRLKNDLSTLLQWSSETARTAQTRG